MKRIISLSIIFLLTVAHFQTSAQFKPKFTKDPSKITVKKPIGKPIVTHLQSSTTGLYKSSNGDKIYLAVHDRDFVWLHVNTNNIYRSLLKGTIRSNGQFYGHLTSLEDRGFTRKGVRNLGFEAKGNVLRITPQSGGQTMVFTKQNQFNFLTPKFPVFFQERNSDIQGEYNGFNDRQYFVQNLFNEQSIMIGFNNIRDSRGNAFPEIIVVDRSSERGIVRLNGTSYTYSNASPAEKSLSFTQRDQRITHHPSNAQITRIRPAYRVHVDFVSLQQRSHDACNDRLDYYGRVAATDVKFAESPGFFARLGDAHSGESEPNVFKSITLRAAQQILPGRSFNFRITLKDEDDLACGGGDDVVDINPNEGETFVSLSFDIFGNILMRSTTNGNRVIGNLKNMGRSPVLNLIGNGRNRDPNTELATLQIRIRLTK